MTDEQFLNAATRGLSRKAKFEAQSELRSHLHERVQQLVLSGQTGEQARVQARRELGPAPAIARSLRRNEQVHPALSFLTLGALAALLLLPLPTLFREQWLAGTGSSSASVAELRAEGAMTLAEARRQLRPLGIGLTRKSGGYVLTHAGLPDAELGVNDAGRCESPSYSAAHDAPTLPFSQTPRSFYIAMPAMLSCMSLAGWPLDIRAGQVFLNGQAFPAIDDANFTLDTREAVLTMLYAPAIAASLRQLPRKVWFAPVAFMNLPAVSPLYLLGPTQTMKLSVPAGTPILLLVKSWSTITDNPAKEGRSFPIFAGAIVRADQKGQVRIPLKSTLSSTFNQPVHLHTSLKTWESAPLQQNAAILLPLTERIIDPIKLQPLQPL